MLSGREAFFLFCLTHLRRNRLTEPFNRDKVLTDGKKKVPDMTAAEVRSKLADALQLDLVGPREGLGSLTEVLPQAPSRWYLTGFLVPLDAGDLQRVDEDSNEEVDAASDAGGADDATPTEPASARKRFLPSSIGLSLLIPQNARELSVCVRWGDYKRRKLSDGHGAGEEWERTQRTEDVSLAIPQSTTRPRNRRARE